MPRTANLSRACLACRARHLKCSEERPTCRACTGAGIICEYKDESDIIFRDQTQLVSQKAKNDAKLRVPGRKKSDRSASASRSSSADDQASTSSTQRAKLKRPNTRTRSRVGELSSSSDRPVSLQLSFSEDVGSVALIVFFSRYCRQIRDPEGEQGLNNLLPSLYIRSEADSACALAVSGFALAIVGRWPVREDWKRLSVEKYSQAVTKLNHALADPHQLARDDILAAVMQVSAYEKTNLPHVPGAALDHLRGLLGLIKARGVQGLTSISSQQILSVIRSNALMVHLSPMEYLEQDDHIWLEAPGDESPTASTRLVKAAADVRILRRMVKQTIARTEAGAEQIEDAVQEIITAALRIDAALVDWPSFVPDRCSPLNADAVSPSIETFQGMCTVYCNVWAANSWNKYRLARIAVHCIILEQIHRLPPPLQDADILRQSQQALQMETNAICSSVPFYLGSRDTARTTDQPVIEFPSNKSMLMTEETREHLITLGEWFLFWPLSRMLHNLEVVERSFPGVLDLEQVAWIRQQVLRNGRRAATRSSLDG